MPGTTVSRATWQPTSQSALALGRGGGSSFPNISSCVPHLCPHLPGPLPTLLGGSPAPTLECRYRCSSTCSSVFCCSRAPFSASSLALCVRTRLWAEKLVRHRPRLPPPSLEDPYASVPATGGRGPQTPQPPEQPSCLQNELGSREQNQKGTARGPVTSTAQTHQELPKEASKSSWTRRGRCGHSEQMPPHDPPSSPLLGHVTHTHWYLSKARYRPSQRFCVA